MSNVVLQVWVPAHLADLVREKAARLSREQCRPISVSTFIRGLLAKDQGIDPATVELPRGFAATGQPTVRGKRGKARKK